MNNTVIRVENVSKQYRLGIIGTGSFTRDIHRWWLNVRGKDDPYRKVVEENDRTRKGESEYVWALKDISFDIKRGDVVGIIGKNGAGKSTLLKILSRTTLPTTGSVKVKGRIASLLEVGTGFHPELTGRQNIFLNGAILGMTKLEIKSKFDEIVDFSGVAKYIDTPVKRYSSGMYVRLAFAVAAHLDPEILIVDEVLAVGDAEFQKKALGKMNEVSQKSGRTILFVSHNLRAVSQLCSKGFVIEKGLLTFGGSIQDSIRHYLKNEQTESMNGFYDFEISNKGSLQFIRATLNDSDGNIEDSFTSREKAYFKLDFNVIEKLVGSRIGLQLENEEGILVFTTTNGLTISQVLEPGVFTAECELPLQLLNEGTYRIILFAGIPGQQILFPAKNILKFFLKYLEPRGTLIQEKWQGVIVPQIDWKHFKH